MAKKSNVKRSSKTKKKEKVSKKKSKKLVIRLKTRKTKKESKRQTCVVRLKKRKVKLKLKKSKFIKKKYEKKKAKVIIKRRENGTSKLPKKTRENSKKNTKYHKGMPKKKKKNLKNSLKKKKHENERKVKTPKKEVFSFTSLNGEKKIVEKTSQVKKKPPKHSWDDEDLTPEEETRRRELHKLAVKRLERTKVIAKKFNEKKKAEKRSAEMESKRAKKQKRSHNTPNGEVMILDDTELSENNVMNVSVRPMPLPIPREHEVDDEATEDEEELKVEPLSNLNPVVPQQVPKFMQHQPNQQIPVPNMYGGLSSQPFNPLDRITTTPTNPFNPQGSPNALAQTAPISRPSAPSHNPIGRPATSPILTDVGNLGSNKASVITIQGEGRNIEIPKTMKATPMPTMPWQSVDNSSMMHQQALFRMYQQQVMYRRRMQMIQYMAYQNAMIQCQQSRMQNQPNPQHGVPQLGPSMIPMMPHVPEPSNLSTQLPLPLPNLPPEGPIKQATEINSSAPLVADESMSLSKNMEGLSSNINEDLIL